MNTGDQHENPRGHGPEDFLTKEELARRLRKSLRTIEYWQRRGFLPFVKLGHSVLFHWPEVEAHFKSFRVMRCGRGKVRKLRVNRCSTRPPAGS